MCRFAAPLAFNFMAAVAIPPSSRHSLGDRDVQDTVTPTLLVCPLLVDVTLLLAQVNPPPPPNMLRKLGPSTPPLCALGRFHFALVGAEALQVLAMTTFHD